MRALVVVLLIVHGLIHLLGVAKALRPASLTQLTLPIAPGWGVAWGIAAALLLAAGVLRLVDSAVWWAPGLAGVVLSQIVVVAFWADAKAGTALNVVLLVAVAVGFGAWRFAGRAQDARAQLAATAPTAARAVVTADDLAALPAPARRWLEAAGVVGRPRAGVVRLTQRGEMQTAPDAAWLPFRAEQTFVAPTPGFVWVVEVRGPAGLPLRGVDRYLDGRGGMRIEVAGLVPIVDAAGPTIDQGTLVRFLAETIWFPSAALEPYLRWEAMDEHAVRARIVVGGVEAEGVFHIDDAGDPVRFEARRYRDDVLEDWIVENDPAGFATLDGVRVPTRSTITWRAADGKTWTWLRLEVERVERSSSEPTEPVGVAAGPRAAHRFGR